MQTAAVVERTRAYHFDARPNHHVRHRGARPERRTTDVRHAGGDGDGLEFACVTERAFADISKVAVVGYLESLQLGTTVKGIVKQRTDAGDRHVLHGLSGKAPYRRVAVAADDERHPIRLAVEDVAVERLGVGVPDHFPQCLAIAECVVRDIGECRWYFNGLKSIGIPESEIRQRLESAADHGVRHGVAVTERPIPHARHAVRNVDRGEPCISKRIAADGKEIG